MTNDKPKKQQKRFITMIVALRLYVLPNPWMNRFVSKMSSANTSILHIQSLFAFTCFFHIHNNLLPKACCLKDFWKMRKRQSKYFWKIVITIPMQIAINQIMIYILMKIKFILYNKKRIMTERDFRRVELFIIQYINESN